MPAVHPRGRLAPTTMGRTSLVKDTAFGHRGNTEAAVLQFRAEFFNALNLANFGLPVNVVRGTGFGIINKTAGASRQVQFSLRLIL